MDHGSFKSIQMFHTHTLTLLTHTADTHPAGAWSTLARQEEEKNGHKRRANKQNSAGGREQTDLRNQPIHGETDLNRAEPTQRGRGIGGRCRDQWRKNNFVWYSVPKCKVALYSLKGAVVDQPKKGINSIQFFTNYVHD